MLWGDSVQGCDDGLDDEDFESGGSEGGGFGGTDVPPGSAVLSGGTPIYRGVPRYTPSGEPNPAVEDALQGIARPRGPNAPVTAEQHNLGNTISPFTSWTRDVSIAEQYAEEGGVVLEWRTGPPPPGSAWEVRMVSGPFLRAGGTHSRSHRRCWSAGLVNDFVRPERLLHLLGGFRTEAAEALRDALRPEVAPALIDVSEVDTAELCGTYRLRKHHLAERQIRTLNLEEFVDAICAAELALASIFSVHSDDWLLVGIGDAELTSLLAVAAIEHRAEGERGED